MKLFLVGLPKSGTSTIQRALVSAGMRSVHWRTGVDGELVGPSILKRFNAGDDPLADWRDYDAITQSDYLDGRVSIWPQMEPAILNAIRCHHPDCQFLLTYRKPTKLLSSIDRWGVLRKKLIKLGAPGLPSGVATSDEVMLEWLETHSREMRNTFFGDPMFREIDIESPIAREQLQHFIGLEIPWWGVANKQQRQSPNE